jgi:hypothetical protein
MAQRKPVNLPTSDADSSRRGLVSLNRLDYTLQPDLSVAVNRSHKKHFFQATNYSPGQRAICILNSGAEYVDPQNSYLQFYVEITSAKQVHMGVGSAVNLIRRIVVTSRSGDEIERLERINLLSPLIERYEKSTPWLNTIGGVSGFTNSEFPGIAASLTSENNRYGFGGDADANDWKSPSDAYMNIKGGTNIPRALVNGTGNYFQLPLSAISGLFRSTDRLLPSMLCSGLRFEIEWESGNIAFMNSDGSTTAITYKVHYPEILLDQYTLTDSIQRVLNEEAAMRGLEVVFTTFFNTTQTVGAANELNMEVRKAVSRALCLIAKSTTNEGTDDMKKDSMASLPWDCKEWQVRIGSLYFPQQPVKTMVGAANAADGCVYESYYQTLHGFGKLKTPSAPPSVSLYDFKKTLGCVCVDLERSNVQKLTGIPINNSRVAELHQTFTTITGDHGARVVQAWLGYVRLLRVFLQNVEIEE